MATTILAIDSFDNLPIGYEAGAHTKGGWHLLGTYADIIVLLDDDHALDEDEILVRIQELEAEFADDLEDDAYADDGPMLAATARRIVAEHMTSTYKVVGTDQDMLLFAAALVRHVAQDGSIRDPGAAEQELDELQAAAIRLGHDE